jgi:hypothetical protein
MNASNVSVTPFMPAGNFVPTSMAHEAFNSALFINVEMDTGL